MKTMLSLWKHRYVRIVGSLLIAIVLMAGVVSCDGVTYNLTMAVSPSGGGTATDVTGTSPYAAGTVINITAVAASCYRFVDWTASAGTFGDPNAATTTFTVPEQDVTVTANFELTPADHFKFYDVAEGTGTSIGKDVELVDQFGAVNATVGQAILFGNPAEKIHGGAVSPIEDANRHYTLYDLEGEFQPESWKVMINNQFQDDEWLIVQGPVALAVPTEKIEAGLGAPECLNHYLIYEVMYESFPEVGVTLKDQFIDEDVVVYEPVFFGNPVQKTIDGVVTDIERPDEHLVFYRIEDTDHGSIDKNIQIDNQFGPQTLALTYRDSLAVPSQKVSWEQPLNHFKAYQAVWSGSPPAAFPVDVQLEDQFVTIAATVGDPFVFANPVSKVHGEIETPIWNPNNHLALYSISYSGDPQVWEVTVKNQFGDDQILYVEGPKWLAVPTRKGPHDPPVGLDHFLVYEVIDVGSAPVSANVSLKDQFTQAITPLGTPYLFAVPCQKTHGSVVTQIKHPEDHLLFYKISNGDFILPELPIGNQFGSQFLGVYEETYDLLGVPSLKTNVDGPY